MTSQPSDPTPLSQRRAHLPVRKFYWAEQFRTARGGFLLLLVLLPLIWFSWFQVARMQQRPTDLAGAPLQSGEAVVVEKSFLNRKEALPPLLLTFRIQKRLVTMRVPIPQEDKWAITKVGDTVPVTYRVGKSGTIYIEDWLPSASKHP